MFLKNSMIASRSIHVRIAFFASRAVMTGVECALAPKKINAGNLLRNKYILCFPLYMLVKKSKRTSFEMGCFEIGSYSLLLK